MVLQNRMGSETPSIHYRWDDLKFVLAVSRTGSLREAGQRLAVNASTVGRRLDALEDAFGRRLFDRTPDGLRLTAAGETLLPAAESLEAAAHRVAHSMEGIEDAPRGSVRVTGPPGIIEQLVAPRIAELRARYPEIVIELDAQVRFVDLTRHEADIALRTVRPERGDLVARRFGESQAVVLSAKPLVLERWDQVDWVSFPTAFENKYMPWFREHIPLERIAMRSMSFSAQLEAVRAGVGVTLGPRIFTACPGLHQAELAPALEEASAKLGAAPLYLVGHQALRQVPRVAAVWEFLAEELFKDRPH